MTDDKDFLLDQSEDSEKNKMPGSTGGMGDKKRRGGMHDKDDIGSVGGQVGENDTDKENDMDNDTE
ncbi:MAG TPA: hypothetical protein VF828_03170 [Patescibacteria group bacterium]